MSHSSTSFVPFNMFLRAASRIKPSPAFRCFSSMVSLTVNGNPCQATISKSLDNKKAILCLPGALGTGATDFAAQLTGLADEYSVIAFHPDTSQVRSLDFLEKNAHDAAAFMAGLGYNKYSVLGWSDGANSSVILAAEYPQHMERLVLMGGNAFVSDEDLALYAGVADVTKWSVKRREELSAIHGGVEELQTKWTEWIATMRRILEEKHGDLCTAYLPDVKCKTLVMHGEEDALVPTFQAEYLSERILHSKLITLPGAGHTFHLNGRWSTHANEVIRTFLNEPDDSATHSREFSAMPPKDRNSGPVVTHSGPRC
ncbi:hypothetical protein H310_00221 [Aphanomyces invadans]|uniref:AB hydrolase-1 domain-containing protein n=1 Tax=Aphanomyces invadans TaxID=157072 RepID=A0A024UUU4_9STRA|nr:hypothetical protein H310_00221 [Aphanomyces invadans]ETW09730.1 hypothetical protein H310_00221 [Aphanomyces invadans]|eukprot:XP_008861141.1 hypothetical protein H310_00221 [Aphanomyces invadans]